MATVGPKAQKRHLRKSVNEVSIPKICEALQTKVPLLLRVSSNLLYGISLLYKQKVGFMANDISLVQERLKCQLNNSIFSSTGTSLEIVNTNERKRGRIDCIKDDMAFDLERDFAQDWSHFLFPARENEFFRNVAEIEQMDKLLNGDRSSTDTRYLANAEERDKLFNDYLDRTNETTLVDMEEELAELDFEFDENGDIVRTSNGNQVQNNNNLLGDLNLDEDYSVTVGVLEDLSKSVNSITNDPNYATTLNQTEATIINPTLPSVLPKKRRLHIDPITRLGTRRGTQLGALINLKDTGSISLTQLIRSISINQPQFVNLCYRLILGPQSTSIIPLQALPLKARHPTVNHIESFLREIDGIERGRDARSRRPSLSFVDDILGPIGAADDDELLGLDLSLETLSPMEEEEDLIDRKPSGNPVKTTKKLKEFEQFLRDRIYRISMRKEQEESISTFENLIPSLNSKVEASVSRKIAAQSFLYVLELATRNTLKLTSFEELQTEVPKAFGPIEIIFT